MSSEIRKLYQQATVDRVSSVESELSNMRNTLNRHNNTLNTVLLQLNRIFGMFDSKKTTEQATAKRLLALEQQNRQLLDNQSALSAEMTQVKSQLSAVEKKLDKLLLMDKKFDLILKAMGIAASEEK